MLYGYAGRVLFVDLTKGTVRDEPLNEEYARQFIGGHGFGARMLYDMMKPGVDPLGPDNVLGFVSGPLTGTGTFFSGRFTVVHKSPITGGWNDSSSGGRWGPELRKAGYDAVFITGAAEKPVYLWINDGKAEIRDASHLWGKNSEETEQAIAEELGDNRVRSAVIGPAGEKLSLIAAIMTDGHRAAGRGGPGAVMGSKKLKAITIRGTGDVPIADAGALKELQRTLSAATKENPGFEYFGEHGTGLSTATGLMSGDAPSKNWGGVSVKDFGEDNIAKVNVFAVDAQYRKKKYACANCPLGCGAEYEAQEGEFFTGKTSRPEYETVIAFGPLCMNSDVNSLLKVNAICNLYGLDTIATGATIAWAIECYENGLITKGDTGGIELTWGNAAAIVAMTQALADRSGFGEVLADGSAAAAKKLGKGFEYLVTVKGIELPMHDPKSGPGLARTYQFDPTPARHVKGGSGMTQGGMTDRSKYDYASSGPMDMDLTTFQEFQYSGGFCWFTVVTGDVSFPAKAFQAVTGLDFGENSQAEYGKRIMNMRHVFNLREGFRPADFVLPGRAIGEVPHTDGPLAGITVDAKMLARNFFAGMEWDEVTGKPSRESLEALGGFDDVIKDLYK